MDVQETVPTASDKMLNSSKGLKNGVGHGGKGKNSNSAGLPRRHRSKSEGHTVGAPIPGIDDSTSAGGVVKSAKDKAHDRKPRNMKGRGLPKKGMKVIAAENLSCSGLHLSDIFVSGNPRTKCAKTQNLHLIQGEGKMGMYVQNTRQLHVVFSLCAESHTPLSKFTRQTKAK